MSKTTFVVSQVTRAIIGVVSNVKNIDLFGNDQIIIAKAEDLHVFSNAQLTELYNNVTGETKNVFKTSKLQSAEKVFAAMEASDLEKLILLDIKEEEKIVEVAAALPESKPKIRDSKLQRMAAAFRQRTESGDYKEWTIKELMEVCSKEKDPLTDGMAHQYISIIRSPSDRFQMPILKNKETKTYKHNPAV